MRVLFLLHETQWEILKNALASCFHARIDMRVGLPWYIYIAAWKFVNPLEFSIFLHKYDPKHNRTSPESRQREPDQTSETKIFSLSLICSGKLSNIAYLWVAKVSESLGLAVNLKVKLECKGVFSQCNDYQMWPVLFKDLFVEVNHVTNKGDYWGPRKKCWCYSSG